MKVIAGIAAFVAVALFAWFIVYPFVFNGVSSLFETNDLGTLIALGVCVLVTIPLIWLAVGLTAGAVLLTAMGEDARDRRRRLKNRRNS